MVKNNTIEMFKSRGIILFIIFMLGITYVNSLGIEKLNRNQFSKNEVVLNK